MRRFLVFFIILGINIRVETADTDALNCKNVSIKSSATMRLKKHLFCEYNTQVMPFVDKNIPIVVDIRMFPQYLEFYERRNILMLNARLALNWIDNHLTWEPKKWDNIGEITVKMSKIWIPDLTVFNSGDSTKISTMGPTDCWISFNGTVNCLVPSKFTSHCPTDYSEWPYDKHDCTIQFGAWLYERNEILLKFGNDSISMGLFRKNDQWRVHIQSQLPEFYGWPGHHDDEGELSVFVRILLKRHASRLTIFYVLPIIVFVLLTLITFCLDAKSTERMMIACANMVCHVLAMADLRFYFPTNGSENTPKILFVYETSIGLAAFALIFTCFARKLRSTTITAPTWIMTLTALVPSNFVRNLLRLEDTDKRETEEGENNGATERITEDRTWQEFTTILEWISFTIVLLTCVIMLAIVLPTNEPVRRVFSFWI